MNVPKSIFEYILTKHGDAMLFVFWLIFTFLIFASAFLMVAILSRLAKISDAKKKKKLRNIFEIIIIQMLDNPGSALVQANILREFEQKFLKNRFQKQILVDELLKAHKGLEGELATKIQDLFKSLGLDHFCFQKLNSASWDVKAAGINELREMQITEAIPSISKMVADKEFIVRGNAQLALLELQDKRESISFLANLTYELSEWEQLRLYESLKSRGNHKHDSFKSLFHSKNISVVMFGVRMSGYFGCHNDLSELSKLSEHPSEEVRLQTIKTLRLLGDFELESHLVQQFYRETPQVKAVILDYLRGIGYNSIQLFLDGLTSHNHQLSLKAAFCLKRGFDEQVLNPILSELKFTEMELRRLQHAEDQRLPMV